MFVNISFVIGAAVSFPQCLKYSGESTDIIHVNFGSSDGNIDAKDEMKSVFE